MQDQNINASSKSTIVIIGIVVVVLLILLLFLLADDKQVSPIPQHKNTEQTLTPLEVKPQATTAVADKNLDFASQLPRYEEEDLPLKPSVPLPELANSDAAFTQDVLAISAQLKSFLFTNQLLRKIIFSINDMAQGMRPPMKRLHELSFSPPFSVSQQGSKIYISAASYQRYDKLAQSIDAIDTHAAVALYQKYLPLFQQVFKQFSYPENYHILDIIKAATAKILDVPVINGEVELIRSTVHYKYANSNLEKLSALDKQMLRMGPNNTRMIQHKLRELIEALIASEKK